MTSASWRTVARLKRGRYRFVGAGALADVNPLSYGRNQGVALRVAGRNNPPANLTGDAARKELEVEFQVDADEEQVELICELRASGGEAWFNLSSLRLVQTR